MEECVMMMMIDSDRPEKRRLTVMVSGSVCVSRLMIIYYDQHGKEEIKKELM